MRRAGHPNIGLIVDSFHTLARELDPNSIRSIPGDKIFFVQLADAPAIDMDLFHWSRHYRCMPGEGDLDVVRFMSAVAATGYDGYVSLEIFNDQFRGGSPKTISVDGHRSLVYLMDRVKRAEPGIVMELPDMPDRVRASGIEFIEFAADESEAEELGAQLTALGFQKAGRHIAKDVKLWRQKIPAIRGVGGGIMHFLDSHSELARVWEIEFEPEEGHAPGEDAGLTSIDHLAQTMNYEEMLTWLLFYTSIFDTRKTPMVDVVDPAGLVRSQAIENPEGSLRITLNGAENRKTLAGHFISESFGSAVQHIAFKTDDIFATVDRLKETGFVPLGISPNYYDDLDARFALDGDLLDRLKDANILYDRDGQGEYFQLYSPNYGEGFFFEIVERRGGYAGYGASNAQFRIAAQKRALESGAG